MNWLYFFFHRILEYISSHSTVTALADCSSSQETSAAASNTDLVSVTKAILTERHPAWPSENWVLLEKRKSFLSNFSLATLTNYFVERQVSSDKRAAADFASISDKAYRLFRKGYISKIETCSCSDRQLVFCQGKSPSPNEGWDIWCGASHCCKEYTSH